MEVFGKYKLELFVKLSDNISMSFDLLRSFTCGDDCEYWENIKYYGPEFISISEYGDIPLTYLPLFKYLEEKNIVICEESNYGGYKIKFKDLDTMVIEVEKIENLVYDILNNYKSYEREAKIDLIIE